MKFLSNVKNANHEIDMAFVRRNQDRKLDLARFHAIFDDIASIQYPSLTKKVCSFHTYVFGRNMLINNIRNLFQRTSKYTGCIVKSRLDIDCNAPRRK